jgi:glycosyltransferase involved in cell wall biosynthesis
MESVEVVGEVDRVGKLAFLESLHALAVPTIYREPKGLFALEAMACGVPVVLPAHGAFPELLASSGGLLVEPNDPRAVAAALNFLRREPERREALAESGLAAVAKHHTIDGTAHHMLNLYGELLADAESKRGSGGRPGVGD